MTHNLDVFFDPGSRSEEDCALICAVLNRVAPLDAEMVGDQKLLAVSRGAVFVESGGGRNLAVMEILTHLSTLASLTQCALACLLFLRSKYVQAQTHVESPAPISADLKAAMMTRIASRPDLQRTIDQQPDLVDAIIAALRDAGAHLSSPR